MVGDPRKRRVDPDVLVFRQPQRASAGVVGGMIGTGRLGDREGGRPPRQEPKRDLTGGRAVVRRDLLQDAAARCSWAGEAAMAEWAVSDDGDSVILAPGLDGMLDCALLQMVKHLIAGDATLAPAFQAASRLDTSKLLTPQDRILPCSRSCSKPAKVVLKRIRARPVQQVTVQPVGAQARERALAGRHRPGKRGVVGRTLETRNTSSRRPAIASPTTVSASPYISAVSMWVMPRSRPRRSAATAVGRCASSMYQVPWPITATSRGRDQTGAAPCISLHAWTAPAPKVANSDRATQPSVL